MGTCALRVRAMHQVCQPLGSPGRINRVRRNRILAFKGTSCERLVEQFWTRALDEDQILAEVEDYVATGHVFTAEVSCSSTYTYSQAMLASAHQTHVDSYAN